MGEAFVLEGSADATVFELSIEQILAPSLQAGQIVVMDHLSTPTGAKVGNHRSTGMTAPVSAILFPQCVADRGSLLQAESMFTPSRNAYARALAGGNWASLPDDHPHDALGWFRHGGYRWSEQEQVA
jgi:hypothetical protein